MQELLEVGLFVALKIKDSISHKTYWIAGEIKEVRTDSYLLKIPFQTCLPFKFKEVINIQVLEH